jgi:hypothetical protein
MSHSPEHHIEHAEHAAHATHDDFNKKVTISIAIVAAVLACITMVGHRAHNETLRLQTEAAIKNNEAANKWAFYQAQNIREHNYRALKNMLNVLKIKEGADNPATFLAAEWQGQIDKYNKNLPEIKKDAEDLDKKSKDLLEESHAVHMKADRFDIGELGVQIAIVLASLAILTKNRVMWIAGLACGVAGAVVALSGHFGILLGNGHH